MRNKEEILRGGEKGQDSGPESKSEYYMEQGKERNQRGKGCLGKGGIMKDMYENAAFEHLAFYANFKLNEAGFQEPYLFQSFWTFFCDVSEPQESGLHFKYISWVWGPQYHLLFTF